MNTKGWSWFAGALGVIVLGYVLLAAGNASAAPLLLVLGYCILVPAALLRAFRSTSEDGGE